MPPDPRIERTRAKALSAAYDLLAEHGYGQVTVEMVSERSGVARSTIYRHWPSSDALMREAFTHTAVGDGVRERDLREALRHYARAFANGLEHVWGTAAVTFASSAVHDPAQRGVLSAWTDQNDADVRAVLQAAVDRGELAALPDVADVGARLLGPLFFRYQFTALALTQAYAEAVADEVADRLLVGGR